MVGKEEEYTNMGFWFLASSVWLDMLYGTFPAPLTFTHHYYHGNWHKPPISCSGKMKSFFSSWKRSVVFQKNERRKKKKKKRVNLEKLWFPCWQTASWAHFYASTVLGFSGLVIPHSLVNLFVLSVSGSVTKAVRVMACSSNVLDGFSWLLVNVKLWKSTFI